MQGICNYAEVLKTNLVDEIKFSIAAYPAKTKTVQTQEQGNIAWSEKNRPFENYTFDLIPW